MKRTPDLLIKGLWALEFKIVRPFGDNGWEAENWSMNLLYPYKGNVSALGDSYKVLSLNSSEKKTVVTVCYEHNPLIISVEPLLDSFELIAGKVMRARFRK